MMDCCCLKGFSTFVSLPPLPEGKGTSAIPDLRVDPDEQDISVSSAVSPDEAEGVESDDATLEARRKRLRDASSKLSKKSKQSLAPTTPARLCLLFMPATRLHQREILRPLRQRGPACLPISLIQTSS